MKQKDTMTEENFTVALCGNPNSGKTTLFNLLTGSNQKVGNWPGVTVEQKRGILRRHSAVTVVDTPGIYSLTPFTPEEKVTESFLRTGNVDLVLNVADSTNLERSLFLTSQLADLGLPLVVALNMKDEARQKGIVLNVAALEQAFGCRFFEISAAKNQGVEELINYCAGHAFGKKSRPTAAETETNANMRSCSAAQTKKLAVGETAAATAEKRYRKISEIVARAQKTTAPTAKEQKARNLTQKIDAVVLNKWLAFPIFAAVMTLMFCCSIGGLGGFLTNLINEQFTPWLQKGARTALRDAPWAASLVADGVIAGVMSVAGFVPQIMLLFGFIAALEACGYMSRIAFITDRLLNKIGLGGRSFVALVLGCGCSVPAIMSCRTIKNEKERNTTITLTPFMPCSAKLAIISYFTSEFFGGNALWAVSFYFVSILAVILGGLVLKAFGKTFDDDTFLMELPEYRAPKVQNVAKQMWERGKAFLGKAGTTILAASIALWALNYFGILESAGRFVAPLFYPLGFNDRGCGWQFAVAAISGIAAKETVFETLQILLPNGAAECISPSGAYAFVVYNILTVPCMAAVSASFAEQGKKGGAVSTLFQCVVAYCVSLLIYGVGGLVQLL